MSWHPVGPMRKRQTLERIGAVHGLECFICRMTVGWIHHLSMGWAYAMPASGVESGSGPKQPDGPGRTRESILPAFPRFPVLAVFLWKIQRADIVLPLLR